jgi:hypothetical protein
MIFLIFSFSGFLSLFNYNTININLLFLPWEGQILRETSLGEGYGKSNEE